MMIEIGSTNQPLGSSVEMTEKERKRTFGDEESAPYFDSVLVTQCIVKIFVKTLQKYT